MIRIKAAGKTIALIIKAKTKINGFVTKPDNPLQLGSLSFSKNNQVKPHQHRALTKTTHQNQEFIYVVSGQLKVTFFNKGESFVKHILNPGDCLLQLSGGHGFTFLKPTKIITIKQGPYSNRKREKIEI
ncbi:MAG: cupin domain-containing protein [Candidatus Beckwithbacteria bacterium]